MFSFLRKKPAPRPLAAPRFTAQIAPEQPFFAIGDVHGCLPQFEALIGRIEATDPDATIICVGDFVDRGEQSAQVLRLAMARTAEMPDRFLCLKGNHEAMLLNFIDDPEAHGARWLKYGGLQTLASFGVGHRGSQDFAETGRALAEAMGPDLIDWVRGLPMQWTSGNVAVVHASANPLQPIDTQNEQALLWGHPAFFDLPRTDGIWVVHGHTIVDAAAAEAGRIAVDTGAYATGLLTAAHVTQTGVQFLTS